MARPSTNLPTLLEKLYQERYTGQTVLHWKDGVPQEVEILERRRFGLTGKEPEPTLEPHAETRGGS